MISRRNLLKTSLIVGSGKLFDPILTVVNSNFIAMDEKKITISEVMHDFEREPLTRPFGFKGGYLSELWQGISYLKTENGKEAIGLTTQSTLWSAPKVFEKNSEAGGNSLMFAISEYALHLVKNKSFFNPIELQEEILEDVYIYGKEITKQPDLPLTFVLNSLVGLDIAAWKLYAQENEWNTFEEMIPGKFQSGLSCRQEKVASIPLISYNTTIKEIRNLVQSGNFFLKMKLGHPGSQEEMLSADKEMLKRVHEAIGQFPNSHTVQGKPLYYFDANGRYEEKKTLLRFIDFAEKVQARGQIALIEEPFPENAEIDVSDIPVRIAADESAHSAHDVVRRIQMGYRAVALKPIAKTLSMTLKMIEAATEEDIPCFCADLTVNPILVDWNKNLAAHLSPFPGLSVGILESNGSQNYKNWDQMIGYHPLPRASWIRPSKGLFGLSNDFYKESGGVLENSKYYLEKIKRK